MLKYLKNNQFIIGSTTLTPKGPRVQQNKNLQQFSIENFKVVTNFDFLIILTN